MEFNRILIIQTAFIGDVVLATPIVRKLKAYYPHAEIDFLLRKGNDELLSHDPEINEILIWDKHNGKNREVFRLIRRIRARKYDMVVNVQRFTSMGLLTCFSGAKFKIGFDKNPLSVFFDRRVPHQLSNVHEVERNLSLVSEFTDQDFVGPRLYVDQAIEDSVSHLKKGDYIVIAPTSVWHTKQLPAKKWISFVDQLAFNGNIYLIGGPEDHKACEHIKVTVSRNHVSNLSGELSLLQSAALIRDAQRNYVYDSAPLHFASAFNAPVTAVTCSTVSDFGFGPLSDDQQIAQRDGELECRPCGLHGHKTCPRGHFKCAEEIEISAFKQP